MGDPVEPEDVRDLRATSASFAVRELARHDPGPPGDRRRPTKLRERPRARFSDFPIPPVYPNTSFARKLAGLAELIDRGHAPELRHASSAPGGYDTHSDQEDSFGDEPRPHLRRDPRLPARPRGTQGLDDRVLMEMWSEFGRRPDENGSAGTDHGAGGLRLRRRHPGAGRDGRRVPRPRQPRRGRQPARGPRTSAACTARCSSSGSRRTPTAIIPGAASCPATT